MDEFQRAAELRREAGKSLGFCTAPFVCAACGDHFECIDILNHAWKEHQNDTHRSKVE